MAQFVLQPYRHRQGKLALDRRQEPLTLNVDELFEKFGLSAQNPLDRLRVQAMKPGAFVGISLGRASQKPVCFVLDNADRSPSYEWILKRDPTFDERIKEVYRIESALWDSSVQEVST
jgi:hypothetical protein